MGLKVIAIDTPSLGDRSYFVHDGKQALVVDPQRDIDRIQTLAEQEGVSIAAVAETHMHNDYVSGGLELARPLAGGMLRERESLGIVGDRRGFTAHGAQRTVPGSYPLVPASTRELPGTEVEDGTQDESVERRVPPPSGAKKLPACTR